jgi:hypothetical protein
VLHRVKRTVFLLQDTTYGGVWVSAKNQYYKKYDLIYGQLNLSEANSQFIMQVRDLSSHNVQDAWNVFATRR